MHGSQRIILPGPDHSEGLGRGRKRQESSDRELTLRQEFGPEASSEAVTQGVCGPAGEGRESRAFFSALGSVIQASRGKTAPATVGAEQEIYQVCSGNASGLGFGI